MWLNIRRPCVHDRLRPLQTGRADFPHPASPRTLEERQCVSRLGRSPTHVARWKRCMPRHTLVGASSMYHATPLTHDVPGRGPSLHRSYPASTLLRPPPTPAQAQSRLFIPLISRVGIAKPQHRRSRSPRFLTDLSTPAVPYHPGEPGRCLCSLLGGPVSGFARFGGLATLD